MALQKKRCWCFWDGVETTMHTMSWMALLIDTNIQKNNIVNTVMLLIIITIIDTSKNWSEITKPKNSD